MTLDRVADRYFEKVQGDEVLSKALFGQKHFLSIVQAFDRVAQRRDYVTRRDLQELVFWGLSPVGSLTKMLDAGVISCDPCESLGQYRYYVVPGPAWEALRTLAGCE